MKKIIAGFLFCLLVAIAAWAEPTTAPVRIDTDPMTWIEPSSSLEIHEKVIGKEYDNAYAAALKKTAAQGGPDIGVEILKVDSDSPAEHLGLKAGDVVMSLESQTVHSLSDWTSGRQAAQDDQMARIWSRSDQKEKLILLPVGLIGVTVNSYFCLERAYVSSLPVNEKASDDVLVAIAEQSANPGVAQTALARAQAAGNKSPFIDLVEANTAFNNLQFDDALAFGVRAMKEMPAYAPKLASNMHVAAMATFHWKLALELEKNYPDCYLKDDLDDDRHAAINGAISEFEKLPRETMANPIEAFAKLQFQDYSDHLAPAGLKWAFSTDFSVREFNQKHHLDFSAASGDEGKIVFGPPGQNVDFSFTCHFKANDNKQSDFAKLITLGVVDKKSKDGAAQMDIHTDGMCWFYPRRNPEPTYGEFVDLYQLNLANQIKGNRLFDVHIAVVGHRSEIVVDGARVYYGPEVHDQNTRNLVAWIDFVGSKGTISNLAWRTARAENH